MKKKSFSIFHELNLQKKKVEENYLKKMVSWKCLAIKYYFYVLIVVDTHIKCHKNVELLKSEKIFFFCLLSIF